MEKLINILLILPILYEFVILLSPNEKYQILYNYIKSNKKVNTKEIRYHRLHLEFEKFQMFYIMLITFGLFTSNWMMFLSIIILSFIKSSIYYFLPDYIILRIMRIDSLITLIMLLLCEYFYWFY